MSLPGILSRLIRPAADRRGTGVPPGRVVAAWALVGLAAVLQGALQVRIGGGTVDPVWLLRWRGAPVALWAAATPGLFLLARRWPVRGARAAAHLALHAVLAGSWILLSNVLLRLPEIVATPAAAVGDALSAAVAYGPGAALLYTLVAAVGHRWAGATGGEVEAVAEALGGETGETSAAPEPDPFEGRLPLREGDRIRLLSPGEIRWIEADGDHVKVHASSRTYRVRGTLKRVHAELRDAGFLRVHRSAVVNLSRVREFQPYFHGDYVAVLDDGTVVRVPRSRREVVERLRDAFVAAG